MASAHHSLVMTPRQDPCCFSPPSPTVRGLPLGAQPVGALTAQENEDPSGPSAWTALAAPCALLLCTYFCIFNGRRAPGDLKGLCATPANLPPCTTTEGVRGWGGVEAPWGTRGVLSSLEVSRATAMAHPALGGCPVGGGGLLPHVPKLSVHVSSSTCHPTADGHTGFLFLGGSGGQTPELSQSRGGLLSQNPSELLPTLSLCGPHPAPQVSATRRFWERGQEHLQLSLQCDFTRHSRVSTDDSPTVKMQPGPQVGRGVLSFPSPSAGSTQGVLGQAPPADARLPARAPLTSVPVGLPSTAGPVSRRYCTGSTHSQAPTTAVTAPDTNQVGWPVSQCPNAAPALA